MTYRSDHDAALARVASLEAENAALQRKLSAKPAPARETPAPRRYWPFVVLIPLIGVSAAAFTSPHARSHSRPHAATTVHDKSNLERCAHKAAAKDKFEEIEMRPKPWGRHPMAKFAAHMPTCTTEVRQRLTDSIISDEERNALEKWSMAEDALSNVVSLITTYYESHPEGTDPYESNHQLWREYDRAFDDRETALTTWQLVVSR